MRKSRKFIPLLSAVVAGTALFAVINANAATIVLSEDFEGTGNSVGNNPVNIDNVGDWVYPISDIEVHSDQKTSGSLSGRYINLPGTYTRTPGVMQSTETIDQVGASVHAEFQLYIYEGVYIAFGLTTDATSSDLENDALLYLHYQGSTGSQDKLGVLQSANGTGTLVDVGDGTVDLPLSAFHKIEFDYVVGDPTGVLTIDNTVVDSTIALRNSGGAVDGFFFTEDNPGNAYNVRYWIDDLSIEYTAAAVPEPASLALLGLGSFLVIGIRKHHAHAS